MRSLPVIVALAVLLVAAAPAGAAVKRLEANLSGAAETAPGGDDDGSGTAKLRLDRAKKRVCFTIRVRDIGDVVAAHIHAGGRGVAGSIAVDLITAARVGQPVHGLHRGRRRSRSSARSCGAPASTT